MRVVILAGGRGLRLQEETWKVPKPMVEIGGRPILWHIMSIYAPSVLLILCWHDNETPITSAGALYGYPGWSNACRRRVAKAG